MGRAFSGFGIREASSAPNAGGNASLTFDWGYTPMLYLHAYASVGSIPSWACDLGVPPGHRLLNDDVRPECNNTGLRRKRAVLLGEVAVATN